MEENQNPEQEEQKPLNVEEHVQNQEPEAEEEEQPQERKIVVQAPKEQKPEEVVKADPKPKLEPLQKEQKQQYVLPVDSNYSEKEPLNVKADGTDAEATLQTWTLDKTEMIKAVRLTQEREQCEELDFLIKIGGKDHLLEGLGVDPKRGINTSEVEARKAQYGTNEFPSRPPKTFCDLVVEALDDLTMQILIVCAIVSLIVNAWTEDLSIAWIEPSAILFAVSACTLVAAGNDYQKEKQFIELNAVAEDKKKIRIMRDGKWVDLHSKYLCCGDVVQIQEGMNIPCDGFVIKGNEVLTDESAMTGETDTIRKGSMLQCEQIKNNSNRIDYEDSLQTHKCPSPILLSGTKIVSGEGRFLVIVVGVDSCSGKIRAALAQEDPEDEGTPLQGKLETLATDISMFGVVGASITVFCLTILWTVRLLTEDGGWEAKYLTRLLDYFIIGVAVIIMAVPEGLPLAVTLSLAFSVKKMLKDHNLVRQLYACETMGGANCICSDKTGTLTMNEMHLVSFWNKTKIDFEAFGDQNLGSNPFNIKSQHTQVLLKLSMCCNSSATLGEWSINEETGEKVREDPQGNKTEVALLQFCERAGADYQKFRDDYVPENGIRYPFTSSRKRMTTQVDYQDKKYLFVKGASEYILGSCIKLHYWDTDEIVDMTPQLVQEINDAIHTMAKGTLRTLCVAYKQFTTAPLNAEPNKQGVYDIETNDLILVCVTGIRDVLRPTVKDSVRKCQIAGIKVRMVTGDNIVTAEAIAIDCGIIQNADQPSYKSEDHVMLGKDFWELIGGIKKVSKKDDDGKDVLDDDGEIIWLDELAKQHEFANVYMNLDVVARCRPEDKYAMVVGLIKERQVVAVTGDGTNDAPALKKADVGFAMGIAGTETAREASDIILLNDSFSSIVQAVMWGRNIYDSVRKFLQFQLTINVVAVVIVFISSLQTQHAILTAVQMLWVNMIMDTFAALALATEPPHEKLLKRQPHNRDDYIVTKRMLKHIGLQAALQAFILLIFTFQGDDFITESLKNDDPDVIERFTSTVDGGIAAAEEKLWEIYDDGEAGNPYDNKTHFLTAYRIVASDEGMIVSGRAFSHWGMRYMYEPMYKVYGPSVHMTVIFNLFVFLQIFNFVNARKIEDELNVFEGLASSHWFVGIQLLICLMQFLIVRFGYKAMSTSAGGLDPWQWLICFLVGSLGLFMSAATKILTPAESRYKKEGDKGKSSSKVVPSEKEQ